MRENQNAELPGVFWRMQTKISDWLSGCQNNFNAVVNQYQWILGIALSLRNKSFINPIFLRNVPPFMPAHLFPLFERVLIVWDCCLCSAFRVLPLRFDCPFDRRFTAIFI